MELNKFTYCKIFQNKLLFIYRSYLFNIKVQRVLIQSNALLIVFLNEMPLFSLTDTSNFICLNTLVQVLE